MPGSLNTVNQSSVIAGMSSIVAISKTRGACKDMLGGYCQLPVEMVDVAEGEVRYTSDLLDLVEMLADWRSGIDRKSIRSRSLYDCDGRVHCIEMHRSEGNSLR
jgi:hypothetical protein